MSEPPVETPTRAGLKTPLSIKLLGIGGAGGNVVHYLAALDLPGVSLVAVNTDAQALANVDAPQKFTLGANLTRGLGAGGEPELGWAAAEQDAEPLKGICAGADVVILVAGLGGGTGTGASPVVARLAKETGALVLAFVFLPFECEGARRYRQAQQGLQHLKSGADGVITLPNQQVLGMIDPHTSLVETFKLTNAWLTCGVRGVWRLLTQYGLVNVDFADLRTVLHGRHTQSSLATAEAHGPDRAPAVVEKLLADPMLEAGRLLTDADAILVSMVGGPDFTIADVNRVMDSINRAAENAHLIMGAAIDPEFGDRLEVTLIASRRSKTPEAAIPPTPRPANGGDTLAPGLMLEIIDREMLPEPRPASRFVPPAPTLTPERAEQILSQQPGASRLRKAANRLRQGQLQLEIIPKDRFAKSQPTFHRGEDLDVPTYIRRGVPLN